MIQGTLRLPDDKHFFFATNTARRLGMDISSQIYEAVKANPIKHSGYLSLLYVDAEYAKELTTLYESILPLEKMEKGMGNYLFAPTYGEEQNCLESVLQELEKYPNMGERLICTAISSPVNRSRHCAVKVMEVWCELTKTSLAKISKELYALVSSIALIESDPDKKERMDKLIEESL